MQSRQLLPLLPAMNTLRSETSLSSLFRPVWKGSSHELQVADHETSRFLWCDSRVALDDLGCNFTGT